MGVLSSTWFWVHPTTYGQSNFSGGVWVNQIFSANHIGIQGIALGEISAHLASFCMSTLSNKELTPGIYPQPCGKHHGDNPTTSKMTVDNIKEVVLANEQNSFHLSKETRFHPSWGAPQIWLWSVFEATIDTTIMQTSLSLAAPIKLNGGWLSLSLKKIDYASFALIM